MVKDLVGPQLCHTSRVALRTWYEIMQDWIDAEEGQQGYATEAIERLIDRAWARCCSSLSYWDARFALQTIRSTSPEIVDRVLVLGWDQERLRQVYRTTTAAAVASTGPQWPRGEAKGYNWIRVPASAEREFPAQFPEVLGSCFGAARLLSEAQVWYRIAGKGKRIRQLPARISDEQIRAIEDWTCEGIPVLPGIEFEDAPAIDRAIGIYERRREAADHFAIRSGILSDKRVAAGTTPQDSMPYALLRSLSRRPAIPVHVPQLNLQFPSPSWYPLWDFAIENLVDQLQPFDETLKSQLGLDCAQLVAGFRALSLVVKRQTQLTYLRPVVRNGSDALELASPARHQDLSGAVDKLASVLFRGYLRVSLDSFKLALRDELVNIGWGQPAQLSDAFFAAFTGSPEIHGLPKPILFYVFDHLTCVLDLSVWHDFVGACRAVATSAGGTKANVRCDIFEQQVRDRLVSVLSLTEDEIPWKPNRDVYERGANLGDVDFCFLRDGALYHLDMKSRRRSSDYFIGHYHTIDDRLKELSGQIGHVSQRGEASQRKLQSRGQEVGGRFDFLLVPAPEYLALEYDNLWYGEVPRVITVDELATLVSSGSLWSKE